MQVTATDSNTYIAAVVEYHPSNETDAVRFTEANTANYVNIINSKEIQTADIVIFPEATLNKKTQAAKLPEVGERTIPCDDISFSAVVRKISCAARSSGKYVVINLYMERDCIAEAKASNDSRPCTRDNLNIYNTAVAFSPEGMAVAMYVILCIEFT